MDHIFAPKTLQDCVIRHPHSHAALENLINGNTPMPPAGSKRALLLYGPFGSGKTATALAIPGMFEASGKLPPAPLSGINSLLPSRPQRYVVEIPCSSVNILQIEQKIQQDRTKDWLYSPHGYRYIIFDEADQLTEHARGALKTIIEKTEYHIFILTTNDVAALRPSGLVSRSHLIELDSPDVQGMVNRGRSILGAHGVTPAHVPNGELTRLAHASNGDLRDFMTALVAIGRKHLGAQWP